MESDILEQNFIWTDIVEKLSINITILLFIFPAKALFNY
jgi:hypothetical protein